MNDQLIADQAPPCAPEKANRNIVPTIAPHANGHQFNAPSPTGHAVLKRNFPDSDIKAGGLLLCALPPTIIAIVTLLEFALD
ncbi:MAG: hypothetical protein EAZ37_14660 [Burkholderiales bacterium]|nr:MAG: hypothetical protein EAZ43_10330 [Betaproteobacteria bacterium]TAG24919.1 MAG: hypothetical protein EAZ37_14660 [Burkholderiales bacterium]